MTTWAGITVKAAKKARKFEHHRGMSLSRLLENLESRLMLSSNHAGDLDPAYSPGHTTALPGTVDYAGWYTTPLLDITGAPLVDPITGMPSTTVVNNLYGNVIQQLDIDGNPVVDINGDPVYVATGDSQFYYEYGFWGYANYVKSALVPAMNGQPAKIVVADCLTGHLRISRYLYDGPVDANGNASATGQIFDNTFNNNGTVGQPLIVSLGTYGANRVETLGNVVVDAAGNIFVAGSTRQETFGVLSSTAAIFDVNAMLVKITPAGVLDTTFDAEGKVDGVLLDGIVLYDFANGQEEINALLVMPDGKVVIGGSTTVDPMQALGLQLLVEFNRDGSVNNSFGQDGRTVTDAIHVGTGFSGTSIQYAYGSHYNLNVYGGWGTKQYDDRIAVMTLTPAGKILVGGSASIGATDTEFVLARYNIDGTLDTTFNAAGIDGNANAQGAKPGVATLNLELPYYDPAGILRGCGEDGINAIAIDPNGRIVVAGYATPPHGTPNGENWARRAQTVGVLARFSADGILDTTFRDQANGYQGYLETHVVGAPADAFFNALIIQSDGKIVAGGMSYTTKGDSFAVVRYLSNGTVDYQFGTYGVALTRMDTVTQGSQFTYGNYNSGPPQTGTQIGEKAQDIIVGLYSSPTTGAIQAVGFSMTTALFQGTSVSGPGVFDPQISANTLVPPANDSNIGPLFPTYISYTPSFTAFGLLEFVRYTNDSPKFQTDTTRPIATLTAPTPDSALPQYQFQVKYQDESAIRLTTLGSNNIVVTGPNGFYAAAALVAISSSSSTVIPIITDQSPVYVTYSITAPVLGWTSGVYTISLNPLSVSDTSTNYAVGGPLDEVTISAPDIDTPLAVLGTTPDITTLGGLFYDFTVTYTDDVGINVASITSNNIRVTSTTNYSQVATLVNVDQLVNGTQRIATYRIVAPAGGWSSADVGTYQIGMLNNAVGDTAYPLNDPREANNTINPPNGPSYVISHFVKGGSLGSFKIVAPDVTKPTATASLADVTTSGGTSYTFSVIYNDNVAVDVASIRDTNLTVTGPNGFSQLATMVAIQPGGNAAQKSVTYSFTPPGGAWAPTNFGVYTISLNANQVYDTSSNPALPVVLNTFRAYLASDTTRPIAVVLSAPDIVGLGGTSYQFTISFSDNTAIMVSTLATGNVIIQGPNYNQAATFIKVDSTVNGTPRVATYQINAPTGGWAAGNVGTYNIQIAPNQVSDTSGNYLFAGQIGTFTIRLQDTVAPTPALSAAPISLGTANYSFQVSYTDNTAVDTATIGHGEIVVTGPNGYSQVATFQGSSSPVAGTVIATYGITSPGSVWGNADVGSYAINLLGGKVADLSGNVIAAQALGTTNVPDTMGPAMGLNAPNVAGLGATSYQFTVTYTDPSGIDLTSIMDGNVRVTGPNSYSQSALLQSIVTNPNGSRTVTYRVTPPGGVWGSGSGGTYTVTVQNPLVRDAVGNAVTAGVLGSFQVTQAIAAGGTLTANPTTGVNNQPVVLTATVTGNAGTPTGTVTFADGATTLGTVTLTNGTATWAVASLTLGTHNLTATYNGSLSYSSKVLTLSYLVGTVNQRTVNQIYLDILGRNADSSGLNYFVTYLNQGHSRGEVANILLTSQEYRMKTVQSLYQTYLGRNADTGGMNNFLGLLQSGGTMDNVRTTILGSAEYYSRAGSTYEGYISRLYQQVLGRAADQAGLTSWTNTLASGVSRTQVASIFLSVREYRTNLVNSLYTTLLLRNSDAAGLNSWVGRMFTGTTNNSIAIQFINSAEYASVHQLV